MDDNAEAGIAGVQAAAARANGAQVQQRYHAGTIAYLDERILVSLMAIAMIGLIVVWATAKSPLVFYGSLAAVILLTFLWGYARIRRIEAERIERARQASDWQANRCPPDAGGRSQPVRKSRFAAAGAFTAARNHASAAPQDSPLHNRPEKQSPMNRYGIIIIAIAALLLSSGVRAAAGWTGYVTVLELIPTGRHYYEVRLAGAHNPSGCREEEWYYLNYDAPGADKIFDLFIDRMQASLRLKVYVTGVCNLNGYAEISAVSASPNTR